MKKEHFRALLCHSRPAIYGINSSGNPGGKATNKNIKKMKKEHCYYLYILANKKNGTIYTGITNNLFSRIFQHKLKENSESFTAKYGINKLVYFETYQYIQDAIQKEKQIKKWNRKWKIELIEKNNPAWQDLSRGMD